MSYRPRFSHLFKILLRRRDKAAAEGLFLEGSIEFEEGNLDDARTMFLFGTRLDPEMAGNHYNLAVATEKLRGPGREALRAWEDYLRAAQHDPRQSAEAREKAEAHLRALRAQVKSKK